MGKRLLKAAKHDLDGDDVNKFLQVVAEIYEVKKTVVGTAPAKAFTDRNRNVSWKKRGDYMRDLNELHARCAGVFMDYNPDAFNGTCIRAKNNFTAPVLEGFLKAADSFETAKKSFLTAVNADENKISREDVPDYFYSKASALIDNLDMLANWCMYKKTVAELKKLGCSFIGEALESGKLTGRERTGGL